MTKTIADGIIIVCCHYSPPPLNLDQPLHQLEGHTMTSYNDVIALGHLPFVICYLPFGQPF